jgi:hypothetical protein
VPFTTGKSGSGPTITGALVPPVPALIPGDVVALPAVPVAPVVPACAVLTPPNPAAPLPAAGKPPPPAKAVAGGLPEVPEAPPLDAAGEPEQQASHAAPSV